MSMSKYFKQKNANGELKKEKLIIEEYVDEDGVTVHKINPEFYKRKKNQSFEEGLTEAISLFEKSLRFKPSGI